MSSDFETARESIERMVRNHPENVARILANHGGKIETRAAILTPVDTGLLMRATEYNVRQGAYVYGHGEITLTIENRMVYAHYQHERKLNHPNKPTARDHFISIPFEKEIPTIIDDIVQTDIKEATQ